MAVQMLYQQDMGGSPLPQVFQTFDLTEFLGREGKAKGGQSADPEKVRRRVHQAFDRARELVRGTAEHREEIDELIRSQADNWRLERMPVVDRNILRLAIYEMLHEPEVPKLVVVDEAIELAKKYGSDQSGRFINGLLDGLLKQRAFPGSLT
jgi:N utilization substance protein B